ncbi:hypothetical protein CLV47_104185 [Antricoccus suffuscus]|uniref:Uncharacterized protein n=1 Tax=Antricoccus suffuscus TaxID=1629062 RepID=A0A2T1A2Y2_9ACTN|nr:hypothetical protein CLV47_104185 [Antricoccus suffuscus]
MAIAITVVSLAHATGSAIQVAAAAAVSLEVFWKGQTSYRIVEASRGRNRIPSTPESSTTPAPSPNAAVYDP